MCPGIAQLRFGRRTLKAKGANKSGKTERVITRAREREKEKHFDLLVAEGVRTSPVYCALRVSTPTLFISPRFLFLSEVPLKGDGRPSPLSRSISYTPEYILIKCAALLRVSPDRCRKLTTEVAVHDFEDKTNDQRRNLATEEIVLYRMR